MMMRPVAGATSRALALRAAASLVSRRAGGTPGTLHGLLPKSAAISFSSNSVASTSRCYHERAYTGGGDNSSSSSSRSNDVSGDDDVIMPWVMLAMGSALALWSAAANSSDEAALPSCSASSAAGENSSSRSPEGLPRRLKKRISIVKDQDEGDEGRGSHPPFSSSSAAGSYSSSSRHEAEVETDPTSDTTAVDNPGVALVVASTYNGNGPIEDRHNIRQSPRGDFFVSVLDGHGGWQAAEHARKRLNIAAQTELKSTLAKNPEQVKGAITQAFLRVEREYLYQVKAAFELGFGAVARTGACAIMALVRDNRLFVANAGDCRAVLGRRRPASRVGGWVTGGSGDLEAIALSNDHNAKEQAEQAKLKKLHPFEGDVFTCKRPASCYVKGRLQPTRSFGDAYLKYPEFNGQEGTHRSAGRFLPPPYTPPYITAEPEISVHEINTSQDDFVVLASDGLWDHVSNHEAVEIVRKAAYVDGKPEAASDRLVKAVLQSAAENHGISVEELQEVPEGNRRRSMHDDITCVVFYLNGNRNNEGFQSLQGCKVQGVSLHEGDGDGRAAPAQ